MKRRRGSKTIAMTAWILTGVGFVTSARAETLVPTNPYSFSGKCYSQGLWTQQALETSNSIRNFTKQLRDDPNCRAIAQDMQTTLGTMETYIRPQSSEQINQQLSHLNQQVSAFRQFLSDGDTGFRNRALQGMMTSELKAATIEAGQMRSSPISYSYNGLGTVAGGAVGGPAGAVSGAVVSGKMQAYGGQLLRSSQDGLSIFNHVIETLPAMDQCLTGQGQASGQLLAASVKLLTSFAVSSQDSTGATMAMALSKLTNVLRERHFSRVLRTLNQADFLASMSCLVEMASENYCSTRDSKHLFDEMIKQLQVRPRETEMKRLGTQHPLAGYYVLTQNIPMITDWIQRVQIGVEPRLPTDAKFQNGIFDDVNNFFKQVKTIKGNFAMDVEAMKVIPDESGRKNAARQIVMRLFGILGDGNFSGGSELKNFFTLKAANREIPFYLMGIPMPNEVLGIGTAIQTPSDYLESNYMKMPVFNDPELLVDTVRKNLDSLLKIADRNAIEYYNKWFIVDKLSLVNETFLGTNYSVKESFMYVSQYLEQLEKRMIANGDTDMIASLQDTRTRIRNVLNTYIELELISKSLRTSRDDLTVAEREIIEAASVKIITSVYEEFQVLLGKSGWFSNRIIKFVYADYLALLKKGNVFNESVNDLFYATGLSIFDDIIMSGNGNPAKVQNDLSMALRLNKMNLEAVEDLIGGHFAGTAADLKAVAKLSQNKSVLTNRVNTKLSTFDRAYKDQTVQLPGEEQSHVARLVFGYYAGLWETFKNAFSYIPWLGTYAEVNEKYAARNERSAIDDEFGSSRRLFEQFCIQSLAFGDVRSYYRLCHYSKLGSPFAEGFLANLTDKQRSELTMSYDDKLVEKRESPELNASKRICAFRDYNRKNLVMYLTSEQAK